jgi:hypothetical protein
MPDAGNESSTEERESSTPEWPGVTREETLSEWALIARRKLADAAKSYDWDTAFEVLAANREFVNAPRPGSVALYAPLHQAAHGGAPEDVVRRLLGLGAWRTLQNSRGERPVDVATRLGRASLVPLLEPAYQRQVPHGILLKIQSQFHDVISERAGDLVRKHALRLPQLEPLLELENPNVWFPIPGMYGGFSYRLEQAGGEREADRGQLVPRRRGLRGAARDHVGGRRSR